MGVMESMLLPRQYPDISVRGVLGPVVDLTTSAWQWLAALLCLSLHSALTFQLPVPGLKLSLPRKGKCKDGFYPMSSRSTGII